MTNTTYKTFSNDTISSHFLYLSTWFSMGLFISHSIFDYMPSWGKWIFIVLWIGMVLINIDLFSTNFHKLNDKSITFVNRFFRTKTTEVEWSKITNITIDNEQKLHIFTNNTHRKSEAVLLINGAYVYQISAMAKQIKQHTNIDYANWHYLIKDDNIQLTHARLDKVVRWLTGFCLLLTPTLNYLLQNVYINLNKGFWFDFTFNGMLIVLPIICIFVGAYLIAEEKAKTSIDCKNKLNQLEKYFPILKTSAVAIFILPFAMYFAISNAICVYNEYLIDKDEIEKVQLTVKMTSKSSDSQHWDILKINGEKLDESFYLYDWHGINKNLKGGIYYQLSAYQGKLGYIVITDEGFGNAIMKHRLQHTE